MGEESNWLLFDELINYFDVIVKVEFKKVMKVYKGIIFFVCYELDFYEDWIIKVWDVEEWF